MRRTGPPHLGHAWAGPMMQSTPTEEVVPPLARHDQEHAMTDARRGQEEGPAGGG